MKKPPPTNIRIPTNSGYEMHYAFNSKTGRVYEIGPLKNGAEYIDESVCVMTEFEILATLSYGPEKLKSWLEAMGFTAEKLAQIR